MTILNNTNKRNDKDLCLLCKTNVVCNIESHSISKLLGKGIVKSHKEAGTPFFAINTARFHEKPNYQQDTPKEKYLFCEECERGYFGLLEQEFSTFFHHRLRHIKYSTEFDKHYDNPNHRFVECLKINPYTMHLFFLSIIWRCSISSFMPLKLDKDLEDKIRIELLKFKSLNKTDLYKSYLSNTLDSYPMIVTTSDDDSDPSFNCIGIEERENILLHYIYLNEYILVFAKSIEQMNNLKYINKNSSENFKINVIKNESWSAIQNELRKTVVSIASYNLIRDKKTPHPKVLGLQENTNIIGPY